MSSKLKRAYAVLGVSPLSSSDDEVKRAYKKLALSKHPDKNTSPNAHEEFLEISEAFQTIKKYGQNEEEFDFFEADEDDDEFELQEDDFRQMFAEMMFARFFAQGGISFVFATSGGHFKEGGFESEAEVEDEGETSAERKERVRQQRKHDRAEMAEMEQRAQEEAKQKREEERKRKETELNLEKEAVSVRNTEREHVVEQIPRLIEKLKTTLHSSKSKPSELSELELLSDAVNEAQSLLDTRCSDGVTNLVSVKVRLFLNS